MTINERINIAIENFDEKTDNLDKIIALAYFIGRDEAANFILDKVNAIFAEQGITDRVYFPYLNTKALFASDETKI